MEQIELVQHTLAADPQNLAAAYLGNHNRLELLAEFEANDRVALYFGGIQVTASNAAQFRATYQRREDVYGAEMQRRGVPRMAARYDARTVQPCAQPEQPRTLTLLQKGIALDIRDASDPAFHLSGAVTADTLTVGCGDVNPDTYRYGTIGGDGDIRLNSFSASGCTVGWTPLPAR